MCSTKVTAAAAAVGIKRAAAAAAAAAGTAGGGGASSSSASSAADFDSFHDYVVGLQAAILAGAERLDGSGKKFARDRWERDAASANAGYGLTCVLEGGAVIEKGAANISVVRGTLSAARAQAMSSRGRGEIDPAGGQPYAACAMSLVFHSAHPMVPTLRADVRLFQARAVPPTVACALPPSRSPTARPPVAPPQRFAPPPDAAAAAPHSSERRSRGAAGLAAAAISLPRTFLSPMRRPSTPTGAPCASATGPASTQSSRRGAIGASLAGDGEARAAAIILLPLSEHLCPLAAPPRKP
jgi:hypothetical protein